MVLKRIDEVTNGKAAELDPHIICFTIYWDLQEITPQVHQPKVTIKLYARITETGEVIGSGS